MRRIWTTLAMTVLVAACSSGGASPSASAPAAGGTSVTIVDFDFQPKELHLGVGDSATWTNTGQTNHTVEWLTTDITWPEGAEGAPITPGGTSPPLAFAAAGTFAYQCGIHNNMKGSVIVD